MMRRVKPKLRACRVSEENRISELPDDILVKILNMLAPKEAGRMSVLSKKWRHVWTFLTTLYFNFRSLNTDIMTARGPKLLQLQERVDQVISSHRAPTVDELRIRLVVPLNHTVIQSMDDLLRFAAEKGIKRLAMRFCWCPDTITLRRIRYTFPSLSCDSLTSLALCNVDITGEILESFLCNCLALEYLSVEASESLAKLTVSGSLLRLSRLRIRDCFFIRELEISAPNLHSFSYFGSVMKVLYRSVPKLAQVSFGSFYADELTCTCSDLSTIRSQIEELSLNTSRHILYRKEFVEGLVFTRLKTLNVIASPMFNDNLYCFISLIKACPILQNLKLELGKPSTRKRIKLRKWEGFAHNHLKNVEIVRFIGHATDLEFAVYLMEKASLDKMVVDTRGVYSSETHLDFTQKRKWTRARAELLREYCKPDTKLEIILDQS